MCIQSAALRFGVQNVITVSFIHQLPGKKDLFIDADLMSPLDRIANVTTLKVGIMFIYLLFLFSLMMNLSPRHHVFSLFLQQHEVDKLYKVELKPIVSVSDQ